MRFLYLMHKQVAGRDAFKIGISADPHKRRRQLGAGVTLLAYWQFDEGARKDEASWHRYFQQYRLPGGSDVNHRREWFYLSGEDVKIFVASCTIAEALFRQGRDEAHSERRGHFLQWTTMALQLTTSL